MSTATTVTMDVAPASRMVVAQTRALLLNYLRIPAFSLTSILLPIMFFAFFGLPNVNQKLPDGSSYGPYLLCSFAAYCVSSVMVYNFGIGTATRRGMKQDLLERATPMPPAVSVAANVVTAAVFALVCTLALFAFAIIVGGVRISVGTGFSIVVRVLLGSVPLIGLGMAIGYVSGPNAAPAIANLIYLPLSFASGLFIPIQFLPSLFQKIAPYLPTYHYGQLAWDAVGAASETLARATLGLGIWTVVLFAIAIWAYRRDAMRKFA